MSNQDGLSEKANQNRDTIERIRHRLNAGTISYDEARAEAQPVIDEMNARIIEIGKEFGIKPKLLSFKGLMR